MATGGASEADEIAAIKWEGDVDLNKLIDDLIISEMEEKDPEKKAAKKKKTVEELRALMTCEDGVKADVEAIIDEVWAECKAEREKRDAELQATVDAINTRREEMEKQMAEYVAKLEQIEAEMAAEGVTWSDLSSDESDSDEKEEGETAAAAMPAETATLPPQQQPEAEREEISISSDSDDDVQFISTSFDPAKAQQAKDAAAAKQQRMLALQQQRQQQQGKPMPQLVRGGVPQHHPNLRAAMAVPPGSQMRVAYPYATNTHQFGGTRPRQLTQEQKPPAPQGQIMKRPLTSVIPIQSQSVRPQQAPPPTVDLVEGMKLYAKKHNDIWYKCTLCDIMGKERPKHERKYRIKFDGKGVKLLTGKMLAFTDTPYEVMPVGSRVIAVFREEASAENYYAGIIAEPPSLRNNHRYLVFFDDGYAQYCTPREIHKVCEQSADVWDDIHPDSQEFIRGYLLQYPERPMVRLHKGQVVKTEWNGSWWTAKVTEVDASLVKMYFESDHRIEWIYRGSTRLEPLYTELANQEATKLAGKGRRHNLVKRDRRPLVEYLTMRDEALAGGKEKTESPGEGGKLKQVARKSTCMKAKKHEVKDSTKSSSSTSSPLTIEEDSSQSSCGGERAASSAVLPGRPSTQFHGAFHRHGCCRQCLAGVPDDPGTFRGNNPLLIPQLCGWERQISKQRPASAGKRIVYYRAPCGRRLRNLDELDRYLVMTGSQLTPDLFCYDPQLHTDTEYVPVKTFCDIKDLSYGKETVPISCVNGIDRQYPDYVEYSNQRIPAKGVSLNLDPEFLVGCDCTDGCRDKNKCRCLQMTIEASRANYEQKPNYKSIYKHRRLQVKEITGIYECNSRCKCDCRCTNRVAQNGLSLRLQVFKTEKRGWGLRCLDDIPEGGFICIYAGQLLNDTGANEDGQQYGDEYLAELDYIEVVERNKEGYESDVPDDSGDSDEGTDDDPAGGKGDEEDSDSDYSGGKYAARRGGRQRSVAQKAESAKSTVSDWLRQKAIEAGAGDAVVIISDSDEEPDSKPDSKPDTPETPAPAADSDKAAADKAGDSAAVAGGDGMAGLCITEATSMNVDEDDHEEEEDGDKRGDAEECAKRRSSRVAALSRFSNLPDPKSQKAVSPLKKSEEEKKDRRGSEREVIPWTSTRLCFGEDFCYVMDAKSMGNLGRYLNHSCSPNVFVQNVFVDTHDLRFPWVAFFAGQFIRAGTELTWDYNYEVGSVPGKVLYCYCGSPDCRGRLL